MASKLWKGIRHNKRTLSISLLVSLVFYPILRYLLYLPLRLLEDAFFDWANTNIAEKWIPSMDIIGNFIEWGLPILVALGLLILIFSAGRKFERKKRQRRQKETQEIEVEEIEVPRDIVVSRILPSQRQLGRPIILPEGKKVKRKIKK